MMKNKTGQICVYISGIHDDLERHDTMFKNCKINLSQKRRKVIQFFDKQRTSSKLTNMKNYL